jgi:hypothetical protein
MMHARDNAACTPLEVDKNMEKLLLDLRSAVSHEVTGALRSLSILVDWLQSDLATSVAESDLGPLTEYKKRVNEKLGTIKQSLDSVCDIIKSVVPAETKYWYPIEELLQPIRANFPGFVVDQDISLQQGFVCTETALRCINNTIQALLADNQQSRCDMVFKMQSESLRIQMIIKASENASCFAHSYQKKIVYADQVVLQQILALNEMECVRRTVSNDQAQLEITIPLLGKP